MSVCTKYEVGNKLYKGHCKSYILFLFSCLLVLIPFTGSCQLLDSLSLDTITACTSINEALKDTANILKLDLSKQKLTEFPKEIRKLTNLEYLDLSKTKITDVPSWIGELKDLQYLILSKTEIDSFPPEFGELIHLKWLIMNRSDLERLPHTIGNLKELRGMDLWKDENLYTFPYELKNLSDNLQSLDVRDINLNTQTQQYLKRLLPNTTIYLTPVCPCER